MERIAWTDGRIISNNFVTYSHFYINQPHCDCESLNFFLTTRPRPLSLIYCGRLVLRVDTNIQFLLPNLFMEWARCRTDKYDSSLSYRSRKFHTEDSLFEIGKTLTHKTDRFVHELHPFLFENRETLVQVD